MLARVEVACTQQGFAVEVGSGTTFADLVRLEHREKIPALGIGGALILTRFLSSLPLRSELEGPVDICVCLAAAGRRRHIRQLYSGLACSTGRSHGGIKTRVRHCFWGEQSLPRLTRTDLFSHRCVQTGLWEVEQALG